MASPSCYEIISSYAKAVWEDIGNTEEEAPISTADTLRQWMPPLDTALAISYIHIESGRLLERDPEPDDWQSKVWHRLRRCIAQHGRDFPTQFTVVKKTRPVTFADEGITSPDGIDITTDLFQFDMPYEDVDIHNPDEIKHRINAQMATFAVLGGWDTKRIRSEFLQEKGITSLEDGIEAVFHLWFEVNQRHPDEFRFPLEPIIRQWITETTAKHISKNRDRLHPVAVLKHPMGNIREIVPSASNWNEELGELKGVSAPPPSTEQIEIPGIESPGSVLPDTLPLEAVHMHDGMDTHKRGAVAMPIRLFFEAAMALDPKETRADILIRLGDLLQFLNPDGKYHRTNHLPHVIKGLNSLYYLRIPYCENPDKPSTEVDWIPVLPRTVPNLRSGNDAPVILEVKLPPNAQSGRMVEKDILRLLSKHSAAKTSAYLTACGLFDKYGTVKGQLIDPTSPVGRRDDEDYLVKPDGTRIYNTDGKPLKSPYQAVSHFDREPNEARTHYPILSFDDLIRACFPNGHPKGQRAKYLKRALEAWKGLEEEGVILIERFSEGWRIMPSESHMGRYRALKNSGQG